MAELRYAKAPLLLVESPYEVSYEGAAAAGGAGATPGSGTAGSAASGAAGSGGGAGGGGGGGGGGDTGGDNGGDTDNPVAPVIVEAIREAQQTAPGFVTAPANQNIIANDNAAFFAAASGYPAYQWQASTDGILPFADVVDGGIFSGAQTQNLELSNVPIEYSGYVFQCVATNDGGTDTSASATLTVSAPADNPYIVNDPTDQSAAAGGSAIFSVTAGGTAPLAYQWQVSTDSGLSWSNVPGVTPYSGSQTDTLTINPVA